MANSVRVLEGGGRGLAKRVGQTKGQERGLLGFPTMTEPLKRTWLELGSGET